MEKNKLIQLGASNITKWIGSTTSVIFHTLLFIVSFTLPYTGYVTYERMLLFLTTIVSLEAIYLSIFIQMSINMSHENIEVIHDNIEELGENIEELGENIEEIQEEMHEEDEEDTFIETEAKILQSIQESLNTLQRELELLKRRRAVKQKLN